MSNPRIVPTDPDSFARRYRRMTVRTNGSCPIEVGAIGGLADNECPHENLPTDPHIDCACWTVRPAPAITTAEAEALMSTEAPVSNRNETTAPAR